VRLLRQAAQLLHRPRSAAVADVVRHLVGVQAQDTGAFPLAIRARSRGLTAADIEGALAGERSVVRTWAMRGTLHLVAAEDHGWLVPLVGEPALTGAHRRLGQLGLRGDTPTKAVRLLRRMLANGPLTRAEIRERLEAKSIPAQGQAVVHVLHLAALRGIVCEGPPDGRTRTTVLVRDWLSPARTLDRDEALAELASRYLSCHAPATPPDFAYWSGLRAADARRGWGAISDRLVEVPTARGAMWALRSGPAEPPSGVVRLVPAFDEYLLGWKGREVSVPEAHARSVFPGGGILRPGVLVDGLAAGGWGATRHLGRVRITVTPFGRAPARARLTEEAHDLGEFLEVPVDLVVG